MPTVLIAGASRGIGLGLARQYAEYNWEVHATTRTPDAPGMLGEIEGVTVHPLEVRDNEQAVAIARSLRNTPLDVFIHNAGVSATGRSREEVFQINADAPFLVVEALFSNLCAAKSPKLVLMTSQLGSRGGNRSNLGVYGDSKAALNDRFRKVEAKWRGQGITAVVVHPGWVRTAMGGSNAPLSIAESARGIYEVVAGLRPNDGGRFLTWDGRDHAW